MSMEWQPAWGGQGGHSPTWLPCPPDHRGSSGDTVSSEVSQLALKAGATIQVTAGARRSPQGPRLWGQTVPVLAGLGVGSPGHAGRPALKAKLRGREICALPQPRAQTYTKRARVLLAPPKARWDLVARTSLRPLLTLPSP